MRAKSSATIAAWSRCSGAASRRNWLPRLVSACFRSFSFAAGTGSSARNQRSVWRRSASMGSESSSESNSLRNSPMRLHPECVFLCTSAPAASKSSTAFSDFSLPLQQAASSGQPSSSVPTVHLLGSARDASRLHMSVESPCNAASRRVRSTRSGLEGCRPAPSAICNSAGESPCVRRLKNSSGAGRDTRQRPEEYPTTRPLMPSSSGLQMQPVTSTSRPTSCWPLSCASAISLMHARSSLLFAMLNALRPSHSIEGLAPCSRSTLVQSACPLWHACIRGDALLSYRAFGWARARSSTSATRTAPSAHAEVSSRA